MLQSIEIENFRCFEKTAISGFEQINLITGKNNSGKTALLEALYLALTTDSKNLTENTRQSEKDTEKEKNLYFNQNDRKKIEIVSYFLGGEGILYQFHRSSSRTLFNKMIRNSDGSRSLNQDFHAEFFTAFIFDKSRQLPNNQELTYLLDSIDKKGDKFRVIEALKIIDKSLSDIRTFASFPEVLYLLKDGFSEYQPVYYLGDAVQKIVRYVINILSSYPNKEAVNVLLIDEIENGIHYTAQAEVWRMLIKLCKYYNIQLFATTHSLEMIKAFQQVCSEEEFTGMGGYFELGRQAKSQQIIAVKHDLETLEYELASGDTIRGE
ncbi:AAA family ATPase [Runella aurantiaca]|uniref:ATPase AAA-type core domain-containing protein n=1 Tax=Runella aurantiaca TaxID=2282308 RepID=A0A369IC66_9BACT|nr:AAA family ATPase [Runella aurantiaca]RDB07248.1 hypothetical protein DVG78_04335 [Runella aurantiaca]